MIIPARPCHICQMVVAGLRAADLAEIKATTELPVVAALRASLDASRKSWVALDSAGSPYVIFGVATHPGAPEIGVPWLIATNAQRRNLREFLGSTQRVLADMKCDYDYLMNYTDLRHRESHRWLQRCGYRFDRFIPSYGTEGRPFLRFSKET